MKQKETFIVRGEKGKGTNRHFLYGVLTENPPEGQGHMRMVLDGI